MLTIEDIILGNDQRGVAALRPYLPADFCHQAAGFVLSDSGTVLIATGFYISRAGAPETDGPPGALALGRALEALGYRVYYVTDRYTMPVLSPFVGTEAQLVDFPISDDDSSKGSPRTCCPGFSHRCSYPSKGVGLRRTASTSTCGV